MTSITLGAKGFSCAVSGIGHVRIGEPRENAARAGGSEVFLSAAREKKPLVPRVDKHIKVAKNVN